MAAPKIDASNIQNLSDIAITGQGFVGSNTTNSYYFGSCNQKLRIAADAAFNSSGKDNDPICLPGTRLSVLARIRNWVDGDEAAHIFWLHGLAGTGKSTIARTIARQLYDKGCWMASFFFARNDEKTGRANRFVSTITSQLADKDLEFQKQIQDLIHKDNGSTYRLLSDEWKELFINPLLCLESPRSPLIIIIDALNECEDEGSIAALIQILTQVQNVGQIKLRFLITSQSQSIIRQELQHAGSSFVNFALQDVPDSEVYHDISLFLHDRLSEFNFGTEKIKKLVEKASGVFIWADTASRFLKTHRKIAFLRLAEILESCRAHVPPEEHLNSLYLFVLQQSIDSSLESHHREIMCQEIRIVLGSLVVLFAPLAFDPLPRLIDQSVAKENLYDTLVLFESILDVPEDRLRPIRLHHPSFREFLLTAERCNDLSFRVDECHAHMAIHKRSIDLMLEYFRKDDVCDLRNPGALLCDLNPNDLQQRLPSEIQYACSFWVQHLMKSKAKVLDDDFTHRFIKTHLLRWFEALAWMEQMAEGIATLDLLSSATSIDQSPLFRRLLQDAKRFMQYSQPVVSQAPPQIYLSAIIFAPEDSCVRQQFREPALEVVLQLPMIQNSWSSLLYTFKFPDPVDMVAFMPGGAMAAIAMRNSILLWNLSTGRCVKKLEEHTNKVTSCIFSKNGKSLATSSFDHTVRLWEPVTGQSIHCFEGHTDIVTTVMFSPDDTRLVSASRDKTVRIWNISDGQLVDVLKGHTDWVQNLLFSIDGKVLASSSSDGNIVLWDFSLGEALQKFQLDGFIINMAFTDGGTRLACIEEDAGQRLSLWNLANNNCEFQKRYGDDTCDMVFSLTGRLCAMYNNLDVLLYQLDDKAIFFCLLSGQENDVHAMAFSPNEKFLATGQEDGLIRIWDTATAECSQIFVGRTGVTRIIWSQESDSILSIHAEDSLWLWDLSSEQQSGHENFEFASCDMEDIDLSPSMDVALSTAICSPINLWDTKSGRHIAQLGKTSDVEPDEPIEFSPDGRLLASSSLGRDGIHRVVLWNPLNGDCIKTFQGHSARVTAVRISHDCKILVSASADDTLRIWDLSNFYCSRTIQNVSEGRILRIPANPYVRSSTVQEVVISQDQSTVGSIERGGVGDYVRVWDLSTGRCRQTWDLRPSLVILSLNGEICAMGFIWKEIYVWSTNDGTCLHRLKMHVGIPQGLSCALDGKTLISRAQNEMQLWNLETGQCQQTCDIKTTRLLFRHGLSILQVAGSEIPICSDQKVIGRHSTYDLKGSWITKNDRKLILLPQDYADPSMKLFNEDMVLLGYTSGKVICLSFRSVEISLHWKRKRSC